MKRLIFALITGLSLVAVAYPGRTVQAGATQLYINQSCAGSTVTVTFSWQGNNPGALQQWVDLSIFDNGFAPSTYLGSGPYDGRTTSFTWAGLLLGRTHYVRVNQQLPSGFWDPSTAYYFVTNGCGVAPATQAQVAPPPPPSPSSNCDPNYAGGTDTRTGGCVRQGVGGYDCAGGSGNGPNYVRGPVRVIGTDVYGLDADHDGIGCQ